jgi:putative holliday junction resolvase
MSRLLGIDYGSKRVGIAVTDELQMLVNPLDVFPNNSELLDRIKKLHENYHFEKIILGYPFSEKYKEASKSVESFAEKLKQVLPLEIVFQNEEFSSAYAELYLKSVHVKSKKIKSSIDKFAARKILEDFLAKK